MMHTIKERTTAEAQQLTVERHNQQQQHNMLVSSQSLTEVNDPNCAPPAHQYHYIQYPAYYQIMQDRLSNTTPSATCRCPCSCNPNRAQAQQPESASIRKGAVRQHQHQHQLSDDSQMAVAVIVHQHQQGGGSGSDVTTTNNSQQVTKAKSEQSLITHSYQTLNHMDNLEVNYSPHEEKQLNVDIVDANASCSCDLECTCEVASLPAKSKHCIKVGLSELMSAADEITVSESDNNSVILKRKGREFENDRDTKKSNTWNAHKTKNTPNRLRGKAQKSADSHYNSSQIDIYSDEEDDAINSCLKIQNNGILEEDQSPPLPPRPQPRPRSVVVNFSAHRHGTGIKKYVVWCLICGGFSCLLGVLFLGVYFLLHSYTITVGNFETVPTFVPATLLILTGLCIMSLARRRNRYSYLIKLSGACGLISALTCALVTVTTTVLHMSRLQALRECEYAQKTRTCTCYSDMVESQVERVDKEGVRLVFDSLSDCGVVHGSLYSCLRAIFGLSVAGVLIAVFSCMLVYQLLSHERKKMYWEQLELRCRSLYTSQQGPPLPSSMAAMAAAAGRANVCRCCEQCHAHRTMTLPQATPSAYPWDDGVDGPRFWTGQPPGNFYSPNPGGDDLQNSTAGSAVNSGACRGHNLSHARSRGSGWSWPRMPWQRSSPGTTRFRQTPSSPDSQYGFSNTNSVPPINEATLPNGARDDITMMSQAHSHAQAFSVVTTGNLPYGVWGPPPPYSDPNSPARRGYYQYMQAPNPVCLTAQTDRQSTAPGTAEPPPHVTDCRSHHRSAYIDGNQPADDTTYCATQTSSMRSLAGKRQTANGFKSKGGEYENTFSDSDGCGGGGSRDRFSNTLPTRKAKKRVEAGIKSIGPNSQATQRVNVQNVFMNNSNVDNVDRCISNNEHAYHEVLVSSDNTNLPCGQNSSSSNMNRGHLTQRPKIVGVENSGFQNSADCTPIPQTENQDSCDPTESEVYFADVSSCCNISVQNDNYYDETNHQHTHKLCRNHCSISAHSPVNTNSDEDYLAQRFGKRENSVRSRLPIPQIASTNDYEKASSNNNAMQKETSRQSMCSVESEAKTEFTDLSPSTPCGDGGGGNKFSSTQFPASPQCDNSTNVISEIAPPPPKFVASFPYLSESQSLEAHRRPTRNVNDIIHSSADTQYEVINEQPVNVLNSCKPVLNFPISPKGKRSVKCKNSAASLKTQNVKKANMKDKRFEKSTSQPYQSDLDWSDSSNCTNDRQRL